MEKRSRGLAQKSRGTAFSVLSFGQNQSHSESRFEVGETDSMSWWEELKNV